MRDLKIFGFDQTLTIRPTSVDNHINKLVVKLNEEEEILRGEQHAANNLKDFSHYPGLFRLDEGHIFAIATFHTNPHFVAGYLRRILGRKLVYHSTTWKDGSQIGISQYTDSGSQKPVLICFNHPAILPQAVNKYAHVLLLKERLTELNAIENAVEVTNFYDNTLYDRLPNTAHHIVNINSDKFDVSDSNGLEGYPSSDDAKERFDNALLIPLAVSPKITTPISKSRGLPAGGLRLSPSLNPKENLRNIDVGMKLAPDYSYPKLSITILTGAIFLTLGAATGAILVASGIFAPFGLTILGGVALAASLGCSSAAVTSAIAFFSAEKVPTQIAQVEQIKIKASVFGVMGLFFGATLGALLVATGILAPFGLGLLGGITLAICLGSVGASLTTMGALLAYKYDDKPPPPEFPLPKFAQLPSTSDQAEELKQALAQSRAEYENKQCQGSLPFFEQRNQSDAAACASAAYPAGNNPDDAEIPGGYPNRCPW